MTQAQKVSQALSNFRERKDKASFEEMKKVLAEFEGQKKLLMIEKWLKREG